MNTTCSLCRKLGVCALSRKDGVPVSVRDSFPRMRMEDFQKCIFSLDVPNFPIKLSYGWLSGSQGSALNVLIRGLSCNCLPCFETSIATRQKWKRFSILAAIKAKLTAKKSSRLRFRFDLPANRYFHLALSSAESFSNLCYNSSGC